jgi:hypothetical protein
MRAGLSKYRLAPEDNVGEGQTEMCNLVAGQRKHYCTFRPDPRPVRFTFRGPTHSVRDFAFLEFQLTLSLRCHRRHLFARAAKLDCGDETLPLVVSQECVGVGENVIPVVLLAVASLLR